MSRRDEVVDTFDSLVSNFRTQLATAIDHRDSRPTTSNPTTPSLTSRLSSILDLPTNASSSTAAGSGSRHQQQPQASAPFSDSRHTSIPLPPPPPAPSSSSSPNLPNPHPPPHEHDDALPTYSRRPPVAPEHIASLPSKRLHLLTSRTGKLHLELQARGREHVILIQEEPDGKTDLSGVLKVNLKEPETITHIKIRLKGIVRTLVMKAHASGRHPVSDEITFHESSTTLYTSSSDTFLPANESSDASKLLGTFNFPFSLSVPAQITHYTSSILPGAQPVPLSRPVRPPPSFMLESHRSPLERSANSIIATQSPSSNGLSTGGFEVSCRYFIKITLGRKGLLKLNERWIIPVVFVPRQITPTISPLRELSLSREERPPHSDTDPNGWTEEGKFRMKRSIKKPGSNWRGKGGGMADLEIEGKTIRGHKVERGDAGTPGGTGVVPFEVRIRTSSVAVTGKFVPSMINVFLVQRTAITAQRLTNAQDVVVSRATSMHPIGETADGVPYANGSGWEVNFGGNVRLPPQLGVSFRAPNLSVTYVLCFSINVGGISNDLSPLTIPIELINCPPRQSIDFSPPPPPGPPPPAHSEISPLPPRLPRHPSTPTVVPPDSPPSKTNNGVGTRMDPVGEREEEEAELEAVYGLPPSYFDTVGMDGNGNGNSNGEGSSTGGGGRFSFGGSGGRR